MRSFDESCLTVPDALEPAQIRSIRESHKVSQPVFARYLNMGEFTVEKRQSGVKRLSGMTIKLLMMD
jgi:putative transcriptional regulator